MPTRRSLWYFSLTMSFSLAFRSQTDVSLNGHRTLWIDPLQWKEIVPTLPGLDAIMTTGAIITYQPICRVTMLKARDPTLSFVSVNMSPYGGGRGTRSTAQGKHRHQNRGASIIASTVTQIRENSEKKRRGKGKQTRMEKRDLRIGNFLYKKLKPKHMIFTEPQTMQAEKPRWKQNTSHGKQGEIFFIILWKRILTLTSK